MIKSAIMIAGMASYVGQQAFNRTRFEGVRASVIKKLPKFKDFKASVAVDDFFRSPYGHIAAVQARGKRGVTMVYKDSSTDKCPEEVSFVELYRGWEKLSRSEEHTSEL